MYKTLDIVRDNDKRDDYRETLYISIHVTSVAWCYMVTWENSGGSMSYTRCGDANTEPSDWEEEVKSAIIDNIIGTQTVIEDADDFLAGPEGNWLLTFDRSNFAPECWEER